QISGIIEKMEKEFEKQLDFDLDLPKMFAALHKFIRRINKLLNENNVGKKNAQEILGFLKKIDSVLALFRFEFDKELEPELLSLLTRREEARKHKDFRKADEIRALLLKKGVQLDDTFGGVRWKKIKKLCG
ncbi:MAG: DALR domain-containing protein, partial [archaeon]